MKCEKCGERLKVIETHTKDGIKVRRICYRCKFESFILVPNGHQILSLGYGRAIPIDENKRPIGDIRGNAQTWTDSWLKRLAKTMGHELDDAARDLRQTWPRASSCFHTLRQDDWDDNAYRSNLVNVIKGMARNRVIDLEAKNKPTVASPGAAQKRQSETSRRDSLTGIPAQRSAATPAEDGLRKQEASRPQATSAPEPGKKPSEVRVGQVWTFGASTVQQTVSSIEPEDSENNRVFFSNGHIEWEYERCLLHGNWKLVSEPKEVPSKPSEVRIGQVWRFRNGSCFEITGFAFEGMGVKYKWLEGEYTGRFGSIQPDLLNELKGYELVKPVAEPKNQTLPKPSSVEIGQKWVRNDKPDMTLTVKALHPRGIGVSDLAEFKESHGRWVDTNLMTLYDDWTYLGAGETLPKPDKIELGQLWSLRGEPSTLYRVAGTAFVPNYDTLVNLVRLVDGNKSDGHVTDMLYHYDWIYHGMAEKPVNSTKQHNNELKPLKVETEQFWTLDTPGDERKLNGIYRVLEIKEDDGELLAETVRLGDCKRLAFTCVNMLSNKNWRHVAHDAPKAKPLEMTPLPKPSQVEVGQIWVRNNDPKFTLTVKTLHPRGIGVSELAEFTESGIRVDAYIMTHNNDWSYLGIKVEV